MRTLTRGAVAVVMAAIGMTLVAPTATAAASGPAVAARANPNPVTVESTVQLGETIHPGTGPFKYSWSITSRPAGSTAVLSDPTSPAPTFTPDVPGSYQLSLIVTDSHGLSSSPAFVDVQAFIP